jgi:hypothetical protein
LKSNLRRYIKARFWVILCPINFVGKIRDSVGDMAKKFAAQVRRCSLTPSNSR